MKALQFLVGQRFGRLVVVKAIGLNRHNKRMWRCQCACGAMTTVVAGKLNGGRTSSCGCLRRETAQRLGRKNRTHGHAPPGAATRTYRTWKTMRERCRNPHHHAYAQYGGRGITVCDRWDDFAQFLADMGERPLNTSIERIDNDGNYEPSNCRWASAKDQMLNRRGTQRLVDLDDRPISLRDIAHHLAMPRATLTAYLKRSGVLRSATVTHHG